MHLNYLELSLPELLVSGDDSDIDLLLKDFCIV